MKKIWIKRRFLLPFGIFGNAWIVKIIVLMTWQMNNLMRSWILLVEHCKIRKIGSMSNLSQHLKQFLKTILRCNIGLFTIVDNVHHRCIKPNTTFWKGIVIIHVYETHVFTIQNRALEFVNQLFLYDYYNSLLNRIQISVWNILIKWILLQNE